jgi:hypothetical protein
MAFLALVDAPLSSASMKFPVFSLLAGNFGSRDGFARDCSSSGESYANLTFGNRILLGETSPPTGMSFSIPKPAVRFQGWSDCCIQHHVCRLFTDHNRRRIGIARCQRRHDRGIGDPQARNTMDAKLGIDDCHRVGPHLAGADNSRAQRSAFRASCRGLAHDSV